MVKTLIFAAGIVSAGSALAGNESFEVCTTEGPCAIRVEDAETGQDVWLITQSGLPIRDIWDGTFWLVPESDYAEVRAALPEGQRLTLPGINPTTGEKMRKATPPKTGSGSGTPSLTGGGPLIGGSITINTGDGNPCVPCHAGSMMDIHKEVLKPKPQGGK